MAMHLTVNQDYAGSSPASTANRGFTYGRVAPCARNGQNRRDSEQGGAIPPSPTIQQGAWEAGKSHKLTYGGSTPPPASIKFYECGKCCEKFDKAAWGSLDRFYKDHYEHCGNPLFITFRRYTRLDFLPKP